MVMSTEIIVRGSTSRGGHLVACVHICATAKWYEAPLLILRQHDELSDFLLGHGLHNGVWDTGVLGHSQFGSRLQANGPSRVEADMHFRLRSNQ